MSSISWSKVLKGATPQTKSCKYVEFFLFVCLCLFFSQIALKIGASICNVDETRDNPAFT